LLPTEYFTPIWRNASPIESSPQNESRRDIFRESTDPSWQP